MIKAGLIGVVIGFIYVAGLTLISPFCIFCFTPLFGVGVGYLAAWFDKPAAVNISVGKGMMAAMIAGVGMFFGQILATIITTILISNLEQLPEMVYQMGFPSTILADINENWQTTLATSSFCSLVNWSIMAGLGAIGGRLWYQQKKANF